MFMVVSGIISPLDTSASGKLKFKDELESSKPERKMALFDVDTVQEVNDLKNGSLLDPIDKTIQSDIGKALRILLAMTFSFAASASECTGTCQWLEATTV